MIAAASALPLLPPGRRGGEGEGGEGKEREREGGGEKKGGTLLVHIGVNIVSSK